MTRTPESSCGISALRTTSEPNPSSPRKMLPIPATRMRAVIALPGWLHPPELEVAASIGQRYQSEPDPDQHHQRDDCNEYPTYDFHFELLSGVYGLLSFERLYFVGREVQITAVPVMQIGGGVIVDDPPDMLVALHVLMHRRDAGNPAGDEDVLRVGIAPRPQPDPAATGDPDPVHQHRIEFRTNGVVGQRIPPVDPLGNLRDQTRLGIQRVRIAQHAVQACHRLGRHVVTLVDDPRGTRIGRPRLRL